MKKVFTVAVFAFLSLNVFAAENLVGKWKLSFYEDHPEPLIIYENSTCSLKFGSETFYGKVESFSDYFKITLKSEEKNEDVGIVEKIMYFFVDKECNYIYMGHNAFKTKNSEKRFKLTKIK